MKNVTIRIIVAVAACLAASGAYAYDNATVWNAAHYPANVTVKYALCKPDSFTVPAATLAGGAGKATASLKRAACLITAVSATIQGKSFKVTDYSSPGTSHSRFLIRYMSGDTYKIYLDQELQGIFDREAANENSPEGTFAAPSARQAMSQAFGKTSTLQQCQNENKADIAALQARITAGAAKLSKAQKDQYAATAKSLAPVPGQSGSLEKCHKKEETIAAWKADVDKALGTTK